MISCRFVVGPRKNVLAASIVARPMSAPASFLSVNWTVGVSPFWKFPPAPVPPAMDVITELTPGSIAASLSGWTCDSLTGSEPPDGLWQNRQAPLTGCGGIVEPSFVYGLLQSTSSWQEPHACDEGCE